MHTISPDQLLDKQMQSSIAGYLPSAIATALTSLVLYAFLHQETSIEHNKLNLWLAFQILLCLGWTYLYSKYKKDASSIKKLWANRIEIPLNMASGLGWGLAWVLFIEPDSLNSVIFFNAAISALLWAYAIATPLHPAATHTCTAFCIVPVISKSFLLGGVFSWIGSAAIVLWVSVYFFGKKFNELYLQNLLQLEHNKQLLMELQFEKQQVERVNQEKTRFLAAASHDLRQPIQAMRLFESVLAEQLTQPEQHSTLNKISESNQSLADLLEPLLDLSKLDSGSVKIYPEWLHLDDIFYRLEQQYQDLARTKAIQLRCASTSQQVFTDNKQLQRILSNLIHNAIKHMQRPGIILLGARQRQHGICVEVWDNGQGVPEAEQDSIFYEFYQLNNPERNRAKGMGLGLSIVKRLCNLMHCSLSFSSIPNKGCRFSIEIPPAIHAMPPIPPQPELPLPEPPLPTQQYHILIVEDDAAVLDALNNLLRIWGYHTSTASNLDMAQQILQQHTPNLILTDYQLQYSQTGLDVIHHAHQHTDPSIPAIILTGSSNEAYMQALKQHDFPVLYKPIRADMLKREVLRSLS